MTIIEIEIESLNEGYVIRSKSKLNGRLYSCIARSHLELARKILNLFSNEEIKKRSEG